MELCSLLIYYEKSFIYLCYHTLFIIPYLLTEKCIGISSAESYRITKLLNFPNRKEDDDQKLAFGERATLLVNVS